MAQLNANPAVLEKAAREIEAIVQEIQAQKSQLASSQGKVSAAWKSQHTGLFLSSIETVEKDIGRTSEAIQGIAAQLRATAARIREAERQLAEQQRSGGGGAAGGRF